MRKSIFFPSSSSLNSISASNPFCNQTLAFGSVSTAVYSTETVLKKEKIDGEKNFIKKIWL